VAIIKTIVLMNYDVVVEGNFSITPCIELGTKDSYGTEKVRVIFGEGWSGLEALAVFHAPGGSATKKTVGADGILEVPPEATADNAGRGKIVFLGLANGLQRITVDLPYSIRDHSGIDGDNPGTPTPDVVQQILENSNNAVRVAQAAKNAAENAHRAAEDAAIKAGEEAGGAAASAAAAKKSAEDAAGSSDNATDKAEDAAASAMAAAAAAKTAGDAATKVIEEGVADKLAEMQGIQNDVKERQADVAEKQQQVDASVELARQAALSNGYMQMGVDPDTGHLVYTRTTNLKDKIDFAIVNDTNLEVQIHG
jgi:hypothetical protein